MQSAESGDNPENRMKCAGIPSYGVILWDLNKMGFFPNGRERSHGAPWRGENIDNHIYFMLCRFWLYKNMPKYFKNLFRTLGGQCRHQRPSKTLIIYSTQWEFSVLPSCIAFLTWYMPIYMWGSWWWGTQVHQIAILGPI